MLKKIEIKIGYPPNYQEIKNAFSLGKTKGIIFSYFPYIYNPDNITIPDDFLYHEQIHLDIQKEIGAKKWWDKYLSDESFRYEQELLAYGKQHQYSKNIFKRKEVDDRLDFFASVLSDGVYGKNKTYHEVHSQLRHVV